jgi:hypothetical protein
MQAHALTLHVERIAIDDLGRTDELGRDTRIGLRQRHRARQQETSAGPGDQRPPWAAGARPPPQG